MKANSEMKVNNVNWTREFRILLILINTLMSFSRPRIRFVLTYPQAYGLCTLLLVSWKQHNPDIMSSDIMGKCSKSNVYEA